jgi:transcriptional/translational regulatory protein YebC/TACO1
MIDLDEKAALAALKLLERLDDLDDVQRVFSNANFPAELVEAASA